MSLNYCAGRFDVLPAFLAQTAGGDVYPGHTATLFPNQLVHGWKGFEKVVVLPSHILRGQMDVHRLASEVLAAACTAHGPVKLRAAVTAVYPYWPEAVP